MDEELRKHLELMKDCIYDDWTGIICIADYLRANKNYVDSFIIIKCLFIIQATPEQLEHFAPLMKSEEFADWLNDYLKFVHENEHGNESEYIDAPEEDPYGGFLYYVEDPLDVLAYLLEGDPNKESQDLACRLISLSQRFHAHKL